MFPILASAKKIRSSKMGMEICEVFSRQGSKLGKANCPEPAWVLEANSILAFGAYSKEVQKGAKGT